ncbi:hypothetical protein [Spiroplasma phoeniceum]|uniref:hypothetical protein n=1 Tax=Spiroplasma phoeniceum TaxID=47835 RepID=UPI000DF84779|nr:hypothetical protein [Spiroplasma phoeniceum]
MTLLNKNVNLKNTLLNLFFSVNEFGKLGRGMRQQKLLNFANQEKIFQKMGLNFEIKNFWQAQQKLAMTDIITKNKVVLRFGKEVTENEIL